MRGEPRTESPSEAAEPVQGVRAPFGLARHPGGGGRLRFVFPGRARLGVLEKDALRVELLADQVGLGEVLPRAGRLAILDPAEDLSYAGSVYRVGSGRTS